LEDADRSSGPRMPWSELLRRLQMCNPAIRVKDGSAGSLALYVKKNSDEYTEADVLMLQNPIMARHMNLQVPKDDFFIHHKYVGGFEMHPMPEYASVAIDSSHLATREFRGWRSVLISLVRARVISYQSAIEQFGDPAGDKRAGRWFEQTHNFKQ